MKKASKASLRASKLYKAAQTIESNLNSMVETVIAQVLDPKSKATLNEKVTALRTLSGMILHEDRLKEDLGIKTERRQSTNPLLAILGDVDIVILKALPQEEREKLILEALTGAKQKAERILTLPLASYQQVSSVPNTVVPDTQISETSGS